MKLVNLDNGEILAKQVREATTFAKRLRGLMFTRSLPPDTGLHLLPCRSVHTFFMNYPIDVLHLDQRQVVVGMEPNLPPWRIGRIFHGTASIVELPAGTLDRTGTQIGQAVQFQKIN